jgi:N-acetylglucosamine kinase-like BadF-type ATPase
VPDGRAPATGAGNAAGSQPAAAAGAGALAAPAVGADPRVADLVEADLNGAPVGADPPAAVLAVDVGNSKTDVALVAADGRVLGAARGPTTSHQRIALDAAIVRLGTTIDVAAARAGLPLDATGSARRPIALIGMHCMAGADFPADERLLRRAISSAGWSHEVIVRNDTFAALRAGTARTWGVAVVCGQGTNCVGVAPDGRTCRFAALGEISGDWGGGSALGRAALGAAVRGQDRRGPHTVLERWVPEHYGLRRPLAVTMAIYRGRLEQRRLAELAPLVFRASAAEDEAARRIVERLADEIVAWAVAAIRRLRMTRLDPHVVLAGAVLAAGDEYLHERIASGIRAVAPRAVPLTLRTPPVVGSALLGLDRLGITPDEERRLREQLTSMEPLRIP